MAFTSARASRFGDLAGDGDALASPRLHYEAMFSIKARVTNGRIVVDQATDLPDGTHVELVAIMDHGEDALDAAERSALHRALASAAEDIRVGRLVDGDEVMEGLRSSR